MFKMQTVRTAMGVALFTLLSTQAIGEVTWPVAPDKIALTGCRSVQINVLIDVQDETDSRFGSESLYKSLISNQLTQNGVTVVTDWEPNSVFLEFYLKTIEPTYKSSGNKIGLVCWAASLTAQDYITVDRYDSLLNELRTPYIIAKIWERSNLAFDPKAFDVKSDVKETLSECVTEFVAELREANSASKLKALEAYWQAVDSVSKEFLKESNKQK